MGATEKRRESGAGVAVIGGIGAEMGEAGRRGVYQDWGYRAQASFSVIALCWSWSARGRRGVRGGRPVVTSGRFSIHTSGNDIQHITSIAQRYAAKHCEVAEYHRIRGDVAAHREVFQDLRYRTNSVACGAKQ